MSKSLKNFITVNVRNMRFSVASGYGVDAISLGNPGKIHCQTDAISVPNTAVERQDRLL